MFSWNDGAPTASILRLYLNVGGTATLTSHLSDASAADYTDLQTSAANGATWLYTIRYAAASAGQTLTTTWQLTAGTGVSFIAATLQ